MRSRLVLLVVAILLVAGFAALNWPEVMRTSPLLFGPIVADAPMGLILLGLLALATLVFVLSAGAIRTRSLMETRHHYKELEAQRLLADKAEASRFTELRQYLEENLRQIRERDTILTTELQRELRSQSEASNRMLAARLNELEHRMDSRFERMGAGGRAAAVAPAMGSQPVHDEPMMRDEGMPAEAVRDPGHAEEQRLAQMREEERLREERMRQEREQRAVEGDRPNEQSGWRRWF
jgi:hypothetical protein